MSRIISPAVTFTTSTATSPRQAVQQITTAFVGPTSKGRFFVPTYVENYADFVNKFGGVTRDNYTALSVREYLSETTGATIVAIGGKGYSDVLSANLSIEPYGESPQVIAQIHLSKFGKEEEIDDIEVTGNADDFTLTFKDGGTTKGTYAGLSFARDDDNKFFGEYINPLSNSIHFFVKFLVDPSEFVDGWETESVTIDVLTSTNALEYGEYNTSSTPVILSQDEQELFKIVTLQDNVNRDIKVSIQNVREAAPATGNIAKFDLLVRDYNDTDRRPRILEQFLDLNFDPTSSNYILRQIGDKFESYDSVNQRVVESGVYRNGSSFIRVELIDGDDIPVTAYPLGFEGYELPVDAFKDISAEDIPFYKDPSDEDADYYGVDFTKWYIDYLHTELHEGTTDAVANYILDEPKPFTVGFQGGSDGIDPTVPKFTGSDITTTNTFGFNLAFEQNGFEAYQDAIRTLEDPDTIDIRMLVVPGINTEQHSALVNFILQTMDNRGDVFCLFDAGKLNSEINTMVGNVSTFDTYLGAIYAPWIWVSEPELSQVIPVPPSVFMPAAIAFNDNVSRPWFAPFGLNRGVISSSIKPTILYKLSERDELYENRINPVAKILGEGTVVLGQKTLLADEASPLSRINVVRLLIEAQKFISTVAWRVIGEPINEATRLGLQSTINDYLEVVQEENGLERFEVNFSEQLNTPDVVNRRLIRGVIFLVPQQATEGIQIQFVVGDTGVEFDI